MKDALMKKTLCLIALSALALSSPVGDAHAATAAPFSGYDAPLSIVAAGSAFGKQAPAVIHLKAGDMPVVSEALKTTAYVASEVVAGQKTTLTPGTLTTGYEAIYTAKPTSAGVEISIQFSRHRLERLDKVGDIQVPTVSAYDVTQVVDLNFGQTKTVTFTNDDGQKATFKLTAASN